MDTPQSKVPKRPKKGILIILGLILLLGGGAVWTVFFSPWSEKIRNLGPLQRFLSGPAKESTAIHPGHIYRMDSFIVNLNDENAMRYLKIKIEIESNQEKEDQEYERRLPQLRDAILTILSGKNQKEIMSAEGKKNLKEELKQRFNTLLKNFKVQKIYFTEFIIQ